MQGRGGRVQGGEVMGTIRGRKSGRKGEKIGEERLEYCTRTRE